MSFLHLQFFNIQYWYCVIVSLFGQQCTYVDAYSGVSTTIQAAGTSTTGEHIGFWAWLFGGHAATVAQNTTPGFFSGLESVFGGVFSFIYALISFVGYTASLFLLLGIIVCAIGLVLVRARDAELYGDLPPATEKPHPLRNNWKFLLEHTMSATPARWKEALGSADIMLGELLGSLGYQGGDTAERLKRVPEGAFANLPSAWEAHRIKNFVFAPNSHFILTQREAFRTMKLYEQVFREFDFI